MNNLPSGVYGLANGAYMIVPQRLDPPCFYRAIPGENPTIYWDNTCCKWEAIAVFDTRNKMLTWLRENMRENKIFPFNQMHDIRLTHENGETQPNACVLIMNDQPKGRYIYDLFAQAHIPCYGSPEKYSVDFILNHREKVYTIEGHRYQIVQLMAEANFGDIFIARDLDTQQEVVIKVLKEENDREDEEYEKMRARGSHPNVAQYYGCEKMMDRRWMVIEYIPGQSMREYLQKNEWTQDLNQQYKSANAFIASCGLRSQRENDGGNVLITMKDGKPTVKLIDFGTTALA